MLGKQEVTCIVVGKNGWNEKVGQMTAGGYLGLVVLRVSTMLHGTLANYVKVTNVTDGDGGSYLRFTLLPSGFDLAQWAADMVEVYIGLMSTVATIPGFGADLAKLFTVLLS